MANVPIYNAQPVGRDEMSLRYLESGGEKIEQASRDIEAGGASLAGALNQSQEKQDQMWALKAYSGAQLDWYSKIKQYNDPNTFGKDYYDYVKTAMKNAPNGRASDAFVQHMNGFQDHLMRRVAMQGAQSQVDSGMGSVQDSFSYLRQAAGQASSPAEVAMSHATGQAIASAAAPGVPTAWLQSQVGDFNEQMTRTSADKIADPGQRLAFWQGEVQKGDKSFVSADYAKSQIAQIQQSNIQNKAVARMTGQQFETQFLSKIDQGYQPTTEEVRQQALSLSRLQSEGVKGGGAATLERVYTNLSNHMELAKVKQVTYGSDLEGYDKAKADVISQYGGDSFVAKHFSTYAGQMQGLISSGQGHEVFTSRPDIAAQETSLMGAYKQAQASGDKDQIAAAVKNLQGFDNQSLAFQKDVLHLSDEQLSLMHKDGAKGTVQQMRQAGSAQSVPLWQSIQERYGDNASIIGTQLFGAGLPHETMSILANHPEDPNSVGAEMAKASQANIDTKGGIDKFMTEKFGEEASSKKLFPYLAQNLTDFTSAGIEGRDTNKAQQEMGNTAIMLAQYRSNKLGHTPTQEEVQSAFSDLYDKHFSKMSAYSNNGSLCLIPKESPEGRPYSTSQLNDMQDTLKSARYDIASELKPESASKLMGVQNVSDADLKQVRNLIVNNGQWKMNPDRCGFTLYLPQSAFVYNGVKGVGDNVRSILADPSTGKTKISMPIWDILGAQ